MILSSKIVTFAAWLFIFYNWIVPIEGYYNIFHWTGIGLGLAHIVEAAVFFPKARKAGGNLPLHILQLIIFGYPHAMELDNTIKSKNK